MKDSSQIAPDEVVDLLGCGLVPQNAYAFAMRADYVQQNPNATKALLKAVLEAQSFENRMLKAYIRDWPGETAEQAAD